MRRKQPAARFRHDLALGEIGREDTGAAHSALTVLGKIAVTLRGEMLAETQRLLLRDRSDAPIRAPQFWAAAMSVLATFLLPSATQTAIANGDTRTIRLYHAHTKETIEATYRVNGSYDSAVLKQLNWFLRDWRRDEPTNMDPRLFDVVWEAYRAAGSGGDTVTVMSAYRSPETNAMLRRRSRAVAEYSQHMLGKAMDTSMPGMSMEQVREVGMRMQRGGVGYYPSAGTPFVHLDVGSVRSWPRMSYDQLARLFPDGKTVHLPTNGQPLARYEEARAEIAANGSVAPPSSTSTGFFAWLFGGGSSSRDGGEDEDAGPVAAPRMQARRGRGGVQMASTLPRASVGGGGPSTPGDDGGRDFFAQQASRADARVVPPAAIAAVPAQDSPREELAPPQAAPGRTQVASLAPIAPEDDAAPLSNISPLLDHPAPPRRPPDLVSLVDVPLPPARPVAFASLGMAVGPALAVTAYAGAEPLGLRRDPIGSLLDRSATAAIPARERIVKTAPSRPAVVAAVGPMTGLRAARMPAGQHDPSVVAPRLDRSNFRAMTGSEPAARMTSQTHVGPTLAAARSAARAESAMLTPATGAGAAKGFSKQATDLSSGGFVR